MSSDESTRLSDTLEEADGHDVSRVMSSSGKHRESSPDHHHDRKEDARFEMVERQIGRDLADDVAILSDEAMKDWLGIITYPTVKMVLI